MANFSQPLLSATAAQDHERYHDIDMQNLDVEASLESLEDADNAIYPPQSASPLPYSEKLAQHGREARRGRNGMSSGNRRRYAAIALILVFLVAFAMFSVVHVSSSNETKAEIVPEEKLKPEVEAGVKPQVPMHSPQLLGPPAESFWGKLSSKLTNRTVNNACQR